MISFDRRRASSALLLAIGLAAAPSWAQQAGTLYDPEPPADAGYVRLVLANRESAVDISVDGKPRAKAVSKGTPSDYLILPAGKRSIALHTAGKSQPSFSFQLDVAGGKAITVSVPSLKADSKPMIFEDKGNTNKLKAVLAVYHLDGRAGPLDIQTADGSTKVFPGLQHGTPASIQVNPISVELMATKSGEKAALGRTQLSMTAGGTYSVFVFPGESGQVVIHSAQNKTERYTGK